MAKNARTAKETGVAGSQLPAGFVDAANTIDHLMSDPARADRVAAIRQQGVEMDRVYLDGLAKVRHASEQTQHDVADRLGIGQGDVSKIEHREDMLLSTLLKYLTATGAEDPRIVLRLNGVEVELDLASLSLHSAA